MFSCLGNPFNQISNSSTQFKITFTGQMIKTFVTFVFLPCVNRVCTNVMTCNVFPEKKMKLFFSFCSTHTQTLPRPMQWLKMQPVPSLCCNLSMDSKQASHINFTPSHWWGFSFNDNRLSTVNNSRLVCKSKSNTRSSNLLSSPGNVTYVSVNCW